MVTVKGIVLSSMIVMAVAAAAQLDSSPALNINGKSVAGKAITVKGQTYVPLSSLKAAGVTSSVKTGTLYLSWGPTGGANQVNALEGGINDWLFNGVWRFRVTGIEPNDDDRKGWKVKVELRNGTKTDELSLAGTGLDALTLVMEDGNELKPYNSNDLVDKGINQGGSTVATLLFYDEEGNGRKPDRLLVRIKPDADTTAYMKGRLGIAYTGGDPSFRIRLVPVK